MISVIQFFKSRDLIVLNFTRIFTCDSVLPKSSSDRREIKKSQDYSPLITQFRCGVSNLGNSVPRSAWYR
jgi:hypothetical protein